MSIERVAKVASSSATALANATTTRMKCVGWVALCDVLRDTTKWIVSFVPGAGLIVTLATVSHGANEDHRLTVDTIGAMVGRQHGN